MEAMAALPSLIGAGGSIMGLINGSPADNVQMPPQWRMPYMGEAGQLGYNAAESYGRSPNIFQQLLPNYQYMLGRSGMDNPGAQTALTGAQNAATMGTNAANNQFGLGNFLAGAGQSFMPVAGNILNTAFDPQNALYDRTQHLLQEQNRAASSARGLGMSPFAAGLENKAMSDFNIDWQNTQLGRQLAGAQGAGGVLGVGNNMITGGANLMAGAPNLMYQSNMLPYMANNQMNTDYFGALGQYGGAGQQALQPIQQSFENWMKFLNTGNQSGQVANQGAQVGLNQAQLGFNQNQQLGANLGRSMAGLFGQPGGGGSSGGNAFLPSMSFMQNGMGWG